MSAIDKRTEAELKIHDMVLDVIHVLQGGKMSNQQFQEMMGRLRNIKVLLDNKQFGCASGAHAGPCGCARFVR